MHVTNVVTAWSHSRQEVLGVLRLAYDVLDFARTVATCRLLCAATSIPLLSPLSPLVACKDQDDDSSLLAPAHKPQIPFIVKKDLQKKERIRRLRQSESGDSTVCAIEDEIEWSSSDESIDEGENEKPKVEAKQEFFVNALEAVMSVYFSAEQYDRYVSGHLFQAPHVGGIGARALVYPCWRHVLPLADVPSSSDWIQHVNKDYKDIVQSLFMHHVPAIKDPTSIDCWWLSAVGISEYVSVFVLLSLSNAGSTKRLFHLRQVSDIL